MVSVGEVSNDGEWDVFLQDDGKFKYGHPGWMACGCWSSSSQWQWQLVASLAFHSSQPHSSEDAG